ncbi:MAG: PD-(D/E)XK nuclease family transposase [Ruminococcus sp.]|nr:PD-(D/E)XK nuclease family transposase [Ruminococcus sp.]
MMNEEIKRIVMGLRPIDDDFMKAIFTDNKPLVEYVLRVILGKDDLIVETSETQHDLNFFGSRSLTLDVFAKDSTGKSFNIEVQKADKGAIPQRARYHSAALDISTMPKGSVFDELPDSYVVFITENDVLKGNQATYIIERSIIGRNELFNDGAHIIYVNGAYKDVESPVGKLIHDFMCCSADEMLCPPFAEVTNKYKNTSEGVDYMCKAVEDYAKKYALQQRQEGRMEGRQEGVLETIVSLVHDGLLSVTEAAKRTSLSVEEIQKLAAQQG